MGGGGHETVAAFSYDGSLTDLREELLSICKEELKKHPVASYDEDLFAEDTDKNTENE